MMKRITAFAIAAMLALTAVSCNGTADDPAHTAAHTTVTTAGGEDPSPTETGAEADVETTAVPETTETAVAEPEPVDVAGFLDGMPVYDVMYEDDEYFTEFTRIGAEEYKKYSAGEEYSELYALRFTEYPEIIIIGQVAAEPGIESDYRQVGLNSVILNGVRYYTPKYDSGPGFGVNITEDFVCITAGASGYGDAYYVYDGGVEYHTYPNSEIGTSMYILNESGGVMKYMWYSPQYSLARHYSGALYENYKSPDDHLYDRGTVQLIDGKIEYVADESYTVSEWFASDTYLQEKSGCTTIEEFLVWFKDYNDNGEWEKEYIHVP